ncbi:MAG TPA: class II aldolase/adducin family protein [Nitrososphaera sp.]|nr:class II aldolase/adducin family protein [Nitrososphaera sp.]
MDGRKDLVDCVKSLYAMGLTTSVSGNHSVRTGKSMWITPSGFPRYRMRTSDLIRVDLKTGKVVGKMKPSIELGMHREIYNVRPDVNAIVHTHSPFTIGISISAKFRHVIEEAMIVVGEPAVVANRPSGSIELARAVSDEFRKGTRVVIIKNHGVVAGGKDIHHARAIAESLEEWSKILTVAQVFGGASDWLG